MTNSTYRLPKLRQQAGTGLRALRPHAPCSAYYLSLLRGTAGIANISWRCEQRGSLSGCTRC